MSGPPVRPLTLAAVAALAGAPSAAIAVAPHHQAGAAGSTHCRRPRLPTVHRSAAVHCARRWAVARGGDGGRGGDGATGGVRIGSGTTVGSGNQVNRGPGAGNENDTNVVTEGGSGRDGADGQDGQDGVAVAAG